MVDLAYFHHFILFIFGHALGLWDLVPRPGIESAPAALEVQSCNHWTTREAPTFFILEYHK